MLRRLRLMVAVACLCALWPGPASAADVNVGFSALTYTCPSTSQINFTWTDATGSNGYSLQLVAPLDPIVNGNLTGTYLRQFGTIEVASGTTTSFTVPLTATVTAGSLNFQVMVVGPSGYEGLVPIQQKAAIPIPCTKTT